MTNYNIGRDREYRIRKRLEEKGYLVIRSAGSKTPVDLVAIHPDNEIIFIQVKPKNYSRKLATKIEAELSWLNKLFKGSFRVISKFDELNSIAKWENLSNDILTPTKVGGFKTGGRMEDKWEEL